MSSINIIHGDCMEEWFDNPKTNEDKFLKALSICGDIPDPNGEYESLFFRLYDEIEPLIKRNEQ